MQACLMPAAAVGTCRQAGGVGGAQQHRVRRHGETSGGSFAQTTARRRKPPHAAAAPQPYGPPRACQPRRASCSRPRRCPLVWPCGSAGAPAAGPGFRQGGVPVAAAVLQASLVLAVLSGFVSARRRGPVALWLDPGLLPCQGCWSAPPPPPPAAGSCTSLARPPKDTSRWAFGLVGHNGVRGLSAGL